MNSEKLVKIFKAFIEKNNETFYKIAWEIIDEEKRKKHHLLATQLKHILTENSVASNINYTQHSNSNFEK